MFLTGPVLMALAGSRGLAVVVQASQWWRTIKISGEHGRLGPIALHRQ
jgi:hypothetical protein